jgi:Fungal Zn(2)-Cys(6) binuclear cluster domain
MGGSRRQQKATPVTPDEIKERAKPKRRRTHEDEPSKDDEAAKRRKRRVTRACDQCRQGREKCDGSLPCQTCREGERQCSYMGASKRRGVQPGYIRALEVLLSWILTNLDGASTQLQDLLAREPVTEEIGLLAKDSSTSDDMSHAWLQSQVHKDLESILNGKLAGTSSARDLDAGAMEDQANSGFYDPAARAQEDIEMDLEVRSPGLADLVSGSESTMPKVLSQTYFDPQAQVSSPLAVTRLGQDFTVFGNLPGASPIMATPEFFSVQDPDFMYGSAGLDSFLDELAATEATEAPNLEPQFMQNLGFAPDLDPSQFVSESGEWIFPHWAHEQRGIGRDSED